MLPTADGEQTAQVFRRAEESGGDSGGCSATAGQDLEVCLLFLDTRQAPKENAVVVVDRVNVRFVRDEEIVRDGSPAARAGLDQRFPECEAGGIARTPQDIGAQTVYLRRGIRVSRRVLGGS